MIGWVEDDALRFEGLDEHDIADVNAMLPDFERIEPDLQHIAATEESEWARIARIMPVILKWAPVVLRIGSKIAAKQRELKQ